MKTLNLIRIGAIIVLLICFIPVLNGQDPRPGIECGCTRYDDYIPPAVKEIYVAEGELYKEGFSAKENPKYRLVAEPAAPPYLVTLSIYKGDIMIFTETNNAYGWGFSPDEDKFAMHGFSANREHWSTLVNLDPDPGTEDEMAVSHTLTPPTLVASANIAFSPHGKYIVYASVNGTTGGLDLNVFETKEGHVVYEYSTNTVVGSAAGKSIAGWGFSSDAKDATFLHSFLTDVNQYALYVVNLTKRPYEYIIESPSNNNSYGYAVFSFSPCGDYFAWRYENLYAAPSVDLYPTSSGEVIHASADNFVKLFTEEDGHYIKYADGSSVKIVDNTADNDCPDKENPYWENEMLDTIFAHGVTMRLEWDGDTDKFGVTAYRVSVFDETHLHIKDYLYDDLDENNAIKKYTVTGLEPTTDYYFRVQAGDEAGNWSDDGPEKKFPTSADNPPFWTDLSWSFKDLTETRMTLIWNEARDDYGITQYRVRLGDEILCQVGKDTLNCKLKNLTPGTEYTFSVEAADEADQWTPGPQITKSTAPRVSPVWPQDAALEAADITETSMTVHWSEAEDNCNAIASYEVRMDDDSITTIKFYKRELPVADLEQGTIYKFQIIAIDESGNRSNPPLEGNISTLPSFVVDTLAFGPGNQKRPDIDNNIVVWWDDRNDEGDIWSYDLATDSVKRITSDPHLQYQPAVSDGRIVWTDSRNDIGDIYMFDPAHGVRAICTAPGMQDEPAIEGNIIVWRDSRNGNFDIYMYDISTSQESSVSTRQSNQVSPDVTSGYIVYADDRNGNWDIFLYNTYSGKEKAVCTRSGDQTDPSISGTNMANTVITYSDGGDIYKYNLYCLGSQESCETEVALDVYPFISEQTNSHFADNQLVYQDLLGVNDGVNHNIYAYKYSSSADYYGDGKIAISVPRLETDQVNPRTSKGNIVWQYIKNGNSDIYIWKRPPGSDLRLSLEEVTDPVMVGDTLKYILKVTNDGPKNNFFIKTNITLPVMAKYISATADKGNAVTTGKNILWTIDTLRNEVEASLEITMLTYELAVLGFSAETSGESFETDPSNNKISETTKVKFVLPVDVGEGGMPGMAVESNGIVHLTYFSNDQLMYASKRRTDTKWKYKVLGYCANARFITMVMAPDRNLHCIYTDYFENHFGYNLPLSMMHHGILTPAGEWTSKIIGVNYTGFHSLALDVSESGELYLAWQDAKGAASPGIYKFRRTVNGIWQEPQIVDLYGYDHIDLTVDNEENVHLGYYSMATGLSYRKWTGNTAGPIEKAEPNWKGAQLEGMVTSIETDQNNNPHISYVGQINNDSRENIKHAWKDDKWHNERVDDGSFMSSGNQIALDPAGPFNFGYSHLLTSQIRFSSDINGQWIRQIVSDEISGYQTQLNLLGWDLDLQMDQEGYGHMAYAGVKYALIPPLPYFNVDPDSLDFGSVATGSSRTMTLKLSNPSDKDIKIDAVEIDDPRFSFSQTSFILRSFGKDSIKVTFTQNDQGAMVKTRLRIMYNDPSGMMIDVAVKVNPWQSRLVAEPDRIDFGPVTFNTIADKTLILRNDGPVDLIISEIYRSGIPPGSFIQCDFSILSNNCGTLSPGQTCEVHLQFKPTKTGSQSKPLIVKSSDPNSPITIIGLYGNTPAPQIYASDYSINFGYTPPGVSVTDTIVITNTGDALMNITGISLSGTNADQFSSGGTCSSVDPGDTCSVYITMSPTMQGDLSASLNITSNSQYSGTLSIPLTGTSSPRELTISASLIEFGDVNVSETKYVILELRNTGSFPLTIGDALPMEGADTCESGHTFQFENWNPIAPGAAVTDKIAFHPIFSGDKTAILKIASDDSNEPVKTVILTGHTGAILPLQASVSADPLLGNEPLTVQFQSLVTGGQPPYAYSWDFEDMTSSSEKSLLHVFQCMGTYNVSFRAIDITGNIATANIEIAVAEEGVPVVIAGAESATGEIPFTVHFTARVTGGDPPVSFLWEFGDGTTATLQDPTHLYTIPGTYNVKVTVTDADGDTGTDTEQITAIWNNSIAGELWNETSAAHVNKAEVILFPQGNLVDTTHISLYGNYSYLFPGLQSGNYAVLALPDTVAYPGMLPTYFGDKLTLFEAAWTNVSGHLTGKDIHLINRPATLYGSGIISGYLVAGTKKGLTVTEKTGDAKGDPVPDVYVFIKSYADGKLKAFDISDENGSFSFDGLENGSYYFLADYMGKPMDAANTPLIISDARKDIEIVATVATDRISVKDLTTGIWDRIQDRLKVYPVPADDHITVIIPQGIFSSKSVRMRILDFSGKHIYIDNNYDISGNPIMLDLNALRDGIYLLEASDKEICQRVKIVKMR